MDAAVGHSPDLTDPPDTLTAPRGVADPSPSSPAALASAPAAAAAEAGAGGAALSEWTLPGV